MTVSEAVILDRAKRAALEYRDLTAEHFGDPLPGRSALEQPPVVDRRRKPTVRLSGSLWNRQYGV